MTVRELREKYLEFFKIKGHLQHASGSLIPYDVTGRLDESLLFNGAGMVQFKPYFRGVAEPPHKRLTTCQKCVRTGDIDEVGDLTHLTFFEMLGNFSFGDYFKKDAIAFSWEFMTSKEWLGLDVNRLSFTVFETDDEAYECWSEHLRSVGIDPATRVFRLGQDTNYWPAGSFTAGPPGPCGPNTEMFYWADNSVPVPSGPYSREDWLREEGQGLWLEIWNDVFIQSEWQGQLNDPTRPEKGWKKTGMPDLPFKSVDTGMGLERTACVLQGFKNVYDIDVFKSITAEIIRAHNVEAVRLAHEKGNDTSQIGLNLPRTIDDLSQKQQISARIMADHLRTACFCIGDGIVPGANGRSYVLRRLLRRAILKGYLDLNIGQGRLQQIASQIIKIYGSWYPELIQQRDYIYSIINNEESLFHKTLDKGLSLFCSYIGDRIGTWLSVTAEIERVNTEAFRRFADDNLSFARYSKGKLSIFSILDGLTHPVDTNISALSLFVKDMRTQYSNFSSIIAAEIERNNPAFDKNLSEYYPLNPVDGEFIFFLHDTFGFPLEVSRELCREVGLEADIEQFNLAMLEAQERSRVAGGMDTVYGGVNDDSTLVAPVTIFVGYEKTTTPAKIVGSKIQDGIAVVALDQTPFYAKSGGQVSDLGTIEGDGIRLNVVDVKKQEGIWLHIAEVVEASADLDNAKVTAEVDEDRRIEITRNHTATHMLQAALKEVLGNHVNQAGSEVAPDALRFDFTHGQAMTADEIARVEKIVNERIWLAEPVTIYDDVPIDDAKKMGAMALFGEKYGNTVRVVQIGSMPPEEPCWSRELCGGIHVKNTGQIGMFKIIHEASAASGVRRITAVTGQGVYNYLREKQETLLQAAELLKTNESGVIQGIEKTIQNLREEKKKREKLASQGPSAKQGDVYAFGKVNLTIVQLEDLDKQDAELAADKIVGEGPFNVALISLSSDGKLIFVAKCGDAAVQAGAHAGNIASGVAKITGGGGGGRPQFATAGGKDSSKLAEALAAAPEIVQGMIKG